MYKGVYEPRENLCGYDRPNLWYLDISKKVRVNTKNLASWNDGHVSNKILMLPCCWSSNTGKVQPVSIGRSPYVPEKCSGFPIGLSTKHQHELPNSTTLFDGSFMIFLVLGGGRMVVALLLIVHIHEKKQVQVSSSPSIMLPFAHLLIHFK